MSSSIAATLLKGGKTALSTFRIPIEIDEASTCNIKKNSKQADMLREVKLIPYATLVLCRSSGLPLQDVLSKDVPFGGVPVVFGGDFQQIRHSKEFHD